VGQLIQFHAADLGPQHVRDIVVPAGENGEMAGSFQLPGVIQALREELKLSASDFNDLLRANGLDEYVSAAAA
jgi:hypothetical protein